MATRRCASASPPIAEHSPPRSRTARGASPTSSSRAADGRRVATEVVRVDPVAPDERLLDEAARVLGRGGLVAFPTETFYGLGAAALDRRAVRRVFEVKGRPASMPLLVLVDSEAMVGRVALEIPARARALVTRHWPGALTLVLRASAGLPAELTAGTGTVGVRLPAHATPRRSGDGAQREPDGRRAADDRRRRPRPLRRRARPRARRRADARWRAFDGRRRHRRPAARDPTGRSGSVSRKTSRGRSASRSRRRGEPVMQAPPSEANER
ncbi:MAG: hypothetical protein DMD84_18160 [Candidatus Rokuibacteriota bacterium]|nr:MAG: hypothetical protein DMD84_18160 [Candidatus Rokubacteria bacterium]